MGEAISYPVKPAACHPFLKEGEVCNAGQSKSGGKPHALHTARPRAVCGAGGMAAVSYPVLRPGAIHPFLKEGEVAVRGGVGR